MKEYKCGEIVWIKGRYIGECDLVEGVNSSHQIALNEGTENVYMADEDIRPDNLNP